VIQWIIHNKEWLFAGSGVSVIAVVIYLVKLIGKSKTKPKLKAFPSLDTPLPVSQSLFGPISVAPVPVPPPFSAPSPVHVSGITPAKIYEEIENLPLLLQHKHAKHFADIAVRWKGPVHSIDMLNDSSYCNVYFFPEDSKPNSHNMACFNISISDYPSIKLLHKNSVMAVEGQIASIGSVIKLKNVKIIEGLL
jgi:hypothetical protein